MKSAYLSYVGVDFFHLSSYKIGKTVQVTE